MRIDKYLWCIRFYKTRSLATEACKKNHIKITKKMKKERKLFHLNKFFDDFKNKNKNIKNV